MKLVHIPPYQTDAAWKDGASALGESCVDECTPDQLKMLVGRGERQLVRMDKEGKTVGWAAVRVDALPNFRVLHVTNLIAHNAGFQDFFDELKRWAVEIGCLRIRCSAEPAQARLYRMKLKFTPVYETLEVAL